MCKLCDDDAQYGHLGEPPTELLERALRFYEASPDGQYDYDVVVPLIRAELVRRSA